MRTTSAFGIGVASAIGLFASGCANETFVTAGGDGGTTQTQQQPNGKDSGASTKSDASTTTGTKPTINDAGGDGGGVTAPTRFCDTLQLPADFCADFDSPNDPLSQFVLMSSGGPSDPSLDTSQTASPPNALHAELAASGSGASTVAKADTGVTLDRNGAVSFQLRIDDCASSKTQAIELAKLAVGANAVSLIFQNGNLGLKINNGSPALSSAMPPLHQFGTIRIDMTQARSNTTDVTLSVGGAMLSPVSVQGQVSGSLLLYLGAARTGASADTCSVRFDNVTVRRR